MNRWYRLGLALLLLTGVFGLGVVDEATRTDRWPYPTGADIDADYDSHVGDDVLLFATVEAVDDGGARISVGGETESYELRVRNFDATVQPGGTVQVYGTLAPSYTLDAERVVVVNPAAGSTLFKYGISGVAVLVFLLGFFRYWTVNLDTLTLEARDG